MEWDVTVGWADVPKSFGASLIQWWRQSAKLDMQAIKKMGLACFLSYTLVSNVSYIGCVHLAVASAMRATGASPLVSQVALKHFGVSYAGLFLLQNLLRPLWFGVTVALAPAFDKLVNRIQERTGVQKGTAVFIVTVVVNVVGAFAFLFGGMYLVSIVCGVPLGGSNVGVLLSAGKAARARA
jgi:small-conductance mechanosensitive channel